VAEGGDEDPQRGGVEDPVGRGPAEGPVEERAVVHQEAEPLGQPTDEGDLPVGVAQAEAEGQPAGEGLGPLLPPREQVEERPEGPHQDHPHGGGHDDQHRARGGRLTGVAGRCVEAVHQQERHQGDPEQHVQDHGRADPLGAEGEAGVGAADPGLGQQPVPEGGTRGRAAGGDVAEGEGRHVDAEQAEPLGAVGGEDGVGQLGVGGQGADLEHDAEGQVLDVDVAEGADLGAVAGQQRQRHVEDEQEDQYQADADPHLPTDEGAAVPPAVTVGGTDRPGGGARRRDARPLRPVGALTALDAHSPHVDTLPGTRPDMLDG